jgi:ribosomal protein S15P/S13E
MTGADFHVKAEAQAERLIHSVNAVTELLKANTDLRDHVETVKRDHENKEAENI